MDFYFFGIFLFGGIIGWIIDTLDRSIDRGHFVDGSALHLPFLPIYGFGAVLLISARPILPQQIALQFLIIGILLGALEYIGGVFCVRVLKRRLWNYKTKWNLQGHTDLAHVLAWGVLGLLFLFIEPTLFHVYQTII